MGEDLHLGRAVGFHGAVARQVVRGEVQGGRGFGVELPHRLQLVAGALQGVAGALLGALHGLHQGRAQVAAGPGGKAGLLQEVGREIGGGALAVGAGDGQDHGVVPAGPQGAVGQLQLADDRNPAAGGLRREGDGRAHPGAQHQFLAFLQQGHGVGAPHRRNALCGQASSRCGVGPGLPFGHHDVPALFGEVLSRTDSRTSRTHHHDPAHARSFPPVWHRRQKK